EDGIRVDLVTGVQTCALPILWSGSALPAELRPDPHSGGERRPGPERPGDSFHRLPGAPPLLLPGGARRPADRIPLPAAAGPGLRSEERRVGEGGRSVVRRLTE